VRAWKKHYPETAAIRLKFVSLNASDSVTKLSLTKVTVFPELAFCHFDMPTVACMQIESRYKESNASSTCQTSPGMPG
jgi:hypothetical protein